MVQGWQEEFLLSSVRVCTSVCMNALDWLFMSISASERSPLCLCTFFEHHAVLAAPVELRLEAMLTDLLSSVLPVAKLGVSADLSGIFKMISPV